MCGENRKHGFEAEGGKATFRSTVTVINTAYLVLILFTLDFTNSYAVCDFLRNNKALRGFL